jgi:hypothetical protein
MHNFLKRGKGKVTSSLKKSDIYKHYLKNLKEEKVDVKVYNKFIKELLQAYSTEIVTTGLELRIPKIGKFRVRSKPLHFFRADGERSKSLKVNWKATWDYWHIKYPGLTKDEIINVPDKKVLYHENEHSNAEFYEHFWDNYSTALKYKSFYNFKPSRQYSRLIALVVKDPNRKTFYYG